MASVPLLVKNDFVSAPPGVMLRELLGKRHLRLVREHGGDVLQLVDLRVNLGVHLVVAMADADGDDAAEEIQILVAVGIPDVLIFGVVEITSGSLK